MKNFIAHTDKTRNEMLHDISKTCVEDLFKQIPVHFKDFNISDGMSELNVQKEIKAIAKKNKIELSCFIGGGVYNKFIPAGVNYLIQRMEFLTAYTPYQPEISQGTLQAIYEYQTMITRLTGMDIANASMYDGASAAAEAVLMAHRISKGKKNKAAVCGKINPQYLDVIKTYCHFQKIELHYFDEIPDNVEEYFCAVIQNPDYYGEITEINKPETILIVISNPSALAIIEPPKNADIVVGDVQTLGLPMNFGGPHAGFMACKEQYMRQIPGRLVGATLDADGKTAYTLTLQTREQHIKREKATGNICSNQSLSALSAALYLSLTGENGFRSINECAFKKAHKLAKMLSSKGIKVLNKNFFNEFVIEVENAEKTLDNLKKAGILGGLKLDDKKILVAVTEMNDDYEIENYVNSI